MKKILSIIGIIIALLIGKGIGYLVGSNVGESYSKNNQSTILKRFLNEFIIHNPNFVYPQKIDENTTVTNRYITEVNDVIFVVENIRIEIAKNNFAISIKEFENIIKNDIKVAFCSSLEEKEYLFNNYSTVGLIQKFIDLNDEFITEISFSKSDC